MTCIRCGLRGWRRGIALVGVAVVWCAWGAGEARAQQWRARISTRAQYVEAQTQVLDSVLASETSLVNGRTAVGDTVVTCSGGPYCYFYGSGQVVNSNPAVLDLDLNVFSFGVQGLRAYVSTRFRTDLGGDNKYWPLVQENVSLLYGYLELNRRTFRVRLGRDYEASGLGFYGYDGGSLVYRFRPWRTTLKAYGGWGLARSVPAPITSDALNALGIFQPTERNYLYGFRGATRPTPNTSFDVLYQREQIPSGEGGGVAREQVSVNGTWYPLPAISLLGRAQYDLAAGWWGDAGLTAGWQLTRLFYLEGRLFRYRPNITLQSIWLAFSPVAYNGYGGALGLTVTPRLWFRLWGERRHYEASDASTVFMSTPNYNWQYGAKAGWSPFGLGVQWDIQGGYWASDGFGSTLDSGDLRVGIRLRDELSFGLKFAAFQQIEQFRINDGIVYGIGGDARWRTRAGTLWLSLDHYDHNQQSNAALADWSQWRGALGFDYYIGSEPGRAP